jgi:type II secretory pathway component PulL
MRHLPEDRRARSTWRYVEQQLAEAAAGADPADATISLRLALMLEGVECRVQ